MQAEIISIGTELTSGAKLDTNSQWLSLELSEIGIPVRFHSTMSDDRAPMLEVCRTAVQRSDLVLITGGLGPTLDDLTRELLAELSGTALVLDDSSLRIIEEMFARRGRVMPERNRIQAMFPAGSEPLLNPVGTAPGIWMRLPRDGRPDCLLAAMPGVPSEMKKMYREQVLPRLPQGNRVIRRATIHTFGQGESAVEQMLGDLTARDRNPEVGITASSAIITLRIAASGSSVEECDRMVAETQTLIREKLGDLIFGEGPDTLEGAVAALLYRQRKTLATIECGGTCGLLAQQLALTTHSELLIYGSLVLSNPASILDLLPQIRTAETSALSHCADALPPSFVSAQTAENLAIRCRSKLHSDFALAITPFSVPVNADDVPVCFIALTDGAQIEVIEHRLLSDLTIARPRATRTALDLLRRRLLNDRS